MIAFFSKIASINYDIHIAFWASLTTQLVKNLPPMQETWVQSLGQEDPLEKKNGNPLQYSCLENPMDRGAWQATVHGVTRVGHDLATKPPLSFRYNAIAYLTDYNLVLTPTVYTLGNQKIVVTHFITKYALLLVS